MCTHSVTRACMVLFRSSEKKIKIEEWGEGSVKSALVHKGGEGVKILEIFAYVLCE